MTVQACVGQHVSSTQQGRFQQWYRAAPQKPASAELADITASTTAISGTQRILLIACLLQAPL